MPWAYRFGDDFEVALSGAAAPWRDAMIATVRAVTRLADPRAEGGRYGERRWGYPIDGVRHLVCEIDDKARVVRFCGVSE